MTNPLRCPVCEACGGDGLNPEEDASCDFCNGTGREPLRVLAMQSARIGRIDKDGELWVRLCIGGEWDWFPVSTFTQIPSELRAAWDAFREEHYEAYSDTGFRNVPPRPGYVCLVERACPMMCDDNGMVDSGAQDQNGEWVSTPCGCNGTGTVGEIVRGKDVTDLRKTWDQGSIDLLLGADDCAALLFVCGNLPVHVIEREAT